MQTINSVDVSQGTSFILLMPYYGEIPDYPVYLSLQHQRESTRWELPRRDQEFLLRTNVALEESGYKSAGQVGVPNLLSLWIDEWSFFRELIEFRR